MPLKGNVYAGFVNLPQHPDADMHGIFRVVIRTRGHDQVIKAMARVGFAIEKRDFGRYWTISRSVNEQRATAGHYGELMTCELSSMYVRMENYKVWPKWMGQK
jgi:hypothetical protein